MNLSQMPPATSQQPKVSVLLLAYNLEAYIAQALESILMQQVDAPYEIVIGEDCSTDRTRAIIASYARRYPRKIRPIFRPHNVGMNQNFALTLKACRGKYVALLDGDDYWTSPQKLQRQLEFLEENPHCSVCFHNVNVVYENGSEETHPFHLQYPVHHISKALPKSVSVLEDILPGNFIQTCSVMFRRGLFQELPQWFYAMPTYDWPLHILNAQYGQIAYLNHIWGVYRVHQAGFWSMQMSVYDNLQDVKSMIQAYTLLDRYLHYQYTQLLEEPVIPLYWIAARLLWAERDFDQSLVYLIRAFTGIIKPRHGALRRKLVRRLKELVHDALAGLAEMWASRPFLNFPRRKAD